MKFTKEIVETVKNFIIENLSSHSHDILTMTTDHFQISKPTASKYLNELIESGVIQKGSKGRYPSYKLVDTVSAWTYALGEGLQEDVLWRNDLLPPLKGLPQNVRQACQYGFTEMVNNAIDHSGSKELRVVLLTNAKEVQIQVMDSGVGIFEKIKNDLGLDDPKHSILELAKGKFTSDAQRHSGEGIFFTSRIFDFFAILSGNLTFLGHKDDDWLLENASGRVEGTLVKMGIKKNSPVSIADVFNEYTDPDKQPGFHKTIIPVQLMQYEGESLLSRSQAKRLVTRFDRFLEVILDFDGVSMIGQAFADEVFRVFRGGHPQVNLVPVRCNDIVKNMIERVTGTRLTD